MVAPISKMETTKTTAMETAFKIKNRYKNRTERRAANKEIHFYLAEMTKNEALFIELLFSSTNASYDTLYEQLLDWHKELCRECNQIKRFKHIEVNERYMYEKFKPLEGADRVE